MPRRPLRGPVRGPLARPHGQRAPLALCALLAAAATAVGGCSSGGGSAPGGDSSSGGRTAATTTDAGSAPTPGPATGSPGTSGATAAPPATVGLDEHAAGTTVRLRAGTALVVRLHSTYWSTPDSADPQVLSRTGCGSTPSATCRPGGGCGVSSADFTAVRPGTTHITARRTSCGEAMRCPPGRSGYDVTVTVTG